MLPPNWAPWVSTAADRPPCSLYLCATPPPGGLHKQLAKSRNAREAERSVALEVGPLSVLLVEGLPAYPNPRLHDGGNFLLTGTVTPAALRQAAVRARERRAREGAMIQTPAA